MRKSKKLITFTIEQDSLPRLLYSLSIMHRVSQALQVAKRMGLPHIFSKNLEGLTANELKNLNKFSQYNTDRLRRFLVYLSGIGVLQQTSKSAGTPQTERFVGTELLFALGRVDDTCLMSEKAWEACGDFYPYLNNWQGSLNLNQENQVKIHIDLAKQSNANEYRYLLIGSADALIQSLLNSHLLARALHYCAKYDLVSLLQTKCDGSLSELLQHLIKSQGTVTQLVVERLFSIFTSYGLVTKHGDSIKIGTLLETMVGTEKKQKLQRSVLGMVDSFWWNAFSQLDRALFEFSDSELSVYMLENGISFYQHIEKDAHFLKIFNEGMQYFSEEYDKDITRCTARQMSSFESIVDVGAGNGMLLDEVVNITDVGSRPAMHLYDKEKPEIKKGGRSYEVVESNFFLPPEKNKLPKNKSLYVLKGVLHDFTDAECRTLLHHIGQVMAKNSELLIITRPEAKGEKWDINNQSDLLMLVLFGSRERSQSQWQQLLNETGFDWAAANSARIGDHMTITVKPRGLFTRWEAAHWETTLSLGLNAFRQQRLSDALRHYQCALKQTTSKDSASIRIYLALYDVHIAQSQFEAAQQVLNQAHNLADSIGSDLSELLQCELLECQAKLAIEYSLFEKAALHYEEALDLVPKNSNRRGKLYKAIAIVYQRQGRYHHATKILKEAIDWTKQWYGERSAKLAAVYRVFSQLLADQNHYQEAHKYSEAAKNTYQALYGKKSDAVARVLAIQGTQLFAQAEATSDSLLFDAAQASYQEAIGCFESVDYQKLNNKSMRLLANMHRQLGAIRVINRQWKAGITAFETARKLYEKTVAAHRQDAPIMIEIRLALADAKLTVSEDYVQDKDSKAWLQEAIKTYQTILAFDHDILAKASSDNNATKYGRYALLDHLHVIQQLAKAWQLDGKKTEAVQIYIKEVKHHQQSYPVVALSLAREGLRIAKGLQLPAQVTLYRLYAELLYQREQYDKAILNLQKAMRLLTEVKVSPSDQVDLKQKLQHYQEKRLTLFKSLGGDRDLYIQWMACQDNWQLIQRHFFDSLLAKQQLSNRSKNQVTELIIKLRNILDQSYARFGVESILMPNQSLVKKKDLYFPVKSSYEGLAKAWRDQGLTTKQSGFSM